MTDLLFQWSSEKEQDGDVSVFEGARRSRRCSKSPTVVTIVVVTARGSNWWSAVAFLTMLSCSMVVVGSGGGRSDR